MVDADESFGGFWSLSMDPLLSCSSPLLSTTISFEEELNAAKPVPTHERKDSPVEPSTMPFEYRGFFGFGTGSGVPASVNVMYSGVKDIIKDGRKRWKKRSTSKKRNGTTASSGNPKLNTKKSSITRKQRKGASSGGNSSSASTASSSLSSPTALNDMKVQKERSNNMKRSRYTRALPTPKAHFESVLDQPYPLFFDIDDLFAEYVPEWDFHQRGQMVTHLIHFLELKVCMEDYDANASTSLLAPTPMIDKAWRALVTETELYFQVTESIQDFHGRSREMIHYSIWSRSGKKSARERQRRKSRKVTKKPKKRRKRRNLHIHSAAGTATDDTSNCQQSRLHRTQALFQVYFQEQMPESGDQIIIVNNGYGIDYEGIEVTKSDTILSSIEYEFNHETSTTASAPDDEITITKKTQQNSERDKEEGDVNLNKEQHGQEDAKQGHVVEEQFYEPLGRFLATITSATFAVELQHGQPSTTLAQHQRPKAPKAKGNKDTMSVSSSASNLFGLNWA